MTSLQTPHSVNATVPAGITTSNHTLQQLMTMAQKLRTWTTLLILAMVSYSGLVQAQAPGTPRDVTGYVFDAKTKEDIVGATIIIKEQPTKGTATNLEGRFKLKVGPEAKTIIVGYIGYRKKEVLIPANGGEVKVALQEDIQSKGPIEVVATGLGQVQKKKLDIGSTENIEFSKVAVGSISSFDAGLQGQVAGLQVTQASGMPGGGVTIRVRGVGSMSAGSDPLYIVDGLPITTGAGGDGGGGIGNNVGYQVNPLADFNTSDIENITVLKDAAATAQYGSRGSNGVVIITTKRGKSGRTQFNAGLTFGVSNPTNRVETLNGEEYRRVVNQAFDNSFNFSQFNRANPPSNPIQERRFITFPYLISLAPSNYQYTNTNWMDELMRKDAPMMDLNLSGSGGSEKTTFYAGLSYRDENGVLKGNRFQRLGGRFTVDNIVNERLKVGVSTSITFTLNNLVPSGQPGSGGAQGGFGTAQYRSLPIMPINYPDSVPTRDPNNPDIILKNEPNEASNQFPFNPFYNAYGQFAGTNIALTSNRDYAYNNRAVFRNISNIYAEYNVYNTIKFRTENGIDYYNQVDQSYQSRFLRVSSLGGNLLPTASISDSRTYFVNFNTNNFLTSDNYIFNENHNLKSSIGTSFQRSESYNNSVSGEGLPNDDSRSVSSAQRLLDFSGNESRFAFMSFYAQTNYLYKEKYVAQASYRYDGSSRFGSNNKFGGFFGLGGAYIISEEEWLKKYTWLSLLKIKASYGQTGNASGLGNFQSYGLYTSGAGYALQPGTSPSRFQNADLSWERSEKLDIGIDFSFFNDRIEGGITYYSSISRDMLLGLPIPGSKGLNDGNYIQNVGRVSNSGLEFNVSTKNIVKMRKAEGDVIPKNLFTWSTDFNISSNVNKILDLGGLKPNEITGSLDYGSYIGGQVSTFYLPVFAGVAESDDPNGRWVRGDELIYRAERDANGNLTGRVTDERIRPGINRTGLIDSNRVPVFNKPVQPLFYGGITNNFKVYDFDISVLVTFTYGNWILDDGERQQSYFNGANTLRRSALNAWSPSNTGSDIPKIYYSNAPEVYGPSNTDLRSYNVNDPMAFRNSTRFLHDGSYVRLKTLTIGYTLPGDYCRKAGLRSARVFFSGQNLLTFTKYPGWDPEVVGNLQSNAERNLQQGRTSFDFPQVRSYTIGVNVGF